jgi:hypothetical protein
MILGKFLQKLFSEDKKFNSKNGKEEVMDLYV